MMKMLNKRLSKTLRSDAERTDPMVILYREGSPYLDLNASFGIIFDNQDRIDIYFDSITKELIIEEGTSFSLCGLKASNRKRCSCAALSSELKKHKIRFPIRFIMKEKQGKWIGTICSQENESWRLL